MKIFMIYLMNDKYANIWNSLTADTLIGDAQGYLNYDLDYRIETIENANLIQPIIRKIEEYSPDILGISIPADTLKIFEIFIKEYVRIHNRMNTLLVLGNIIPQSNIDYFANNHYIKKIDYIIGLGHGEFVLRQLIDVVQKKIMLKDVNNIIYWDSKNEKINKNPYFHYNILSLKFPPCCDTVKENQVNMIQTSRGCYYNCSYCSQGPRNTWERLPLDRIFKNISDMFSKGVTKFEFIDEDFLGGRFISSLNSADKIVDYLNEMNKKKRLSYRIFTNPCVIFQEKENKNACTNENMENLLFKMKSSGLVRIYLGVESGSVTQRKRYNRKETLFEIETAFNILNKYEFEIDAGFIMFDPLVTLEEIKDNIKYIKKIDLINAYAWPIHKIALTNNSPYTNMIKKEYNNIIDSYDYDLNIYNYKFKDPDIQMIYTIVDTIAKQTGRLFYEIKFFIKKHFIDEGKNNIQLAKMISKQNATIYLNLLEGLTKYDEIYIEEIVCNVFNNLENLMTIVKNNLNEIDISFSLYNAAEENLKKLKSAICESFTNLQELYKLCSIFNLNGVSSV